MIFHRVYRRNPKPHCLTNSLGVWVESILPVPWTGDSAGLGGGHRHKMSQDHWKVWSPCKKKFSDTAESAGGLQVLL